jgi:hypothetical protein
MTAAEILARAKARGVTIRLDGDGLELVADRKPDSDLLDAIAGCKADIIAFLHPDAVRRRLEAEAEVLRAVRPPDVAADRWATALHGLRAFIAAGHGVEAERLGWPRDELYRVPELWSQINLCGVALLIDDREVIGITPNEIRIRAASGSTLAFYRKPAVNYGVAYRARLKQVGFDASKEEFQLRAIEAVVNLYRSHHPDADVDTAKAAVLAAIKETAA